MLNFRQLRGSVDGQRGSFERLLRHLAEVIPPARATEFRPIEGAGGDGGVEAYWVLEDGTEEGYQAKFHEEAGDINWTALNGSILTAISTHAAMTRITVGMPCDLTDVRRQRGTSARQKWNQRLPGWKEAAGDRPFTVDFLGGSQIERMLADPRAAGLREYWFGERELSETWFREQFERTVAALDERYHPEDHVDVGASQLFQALRGSVDWRGGYRQPLAALAELLPDDPGEGTPDAPWYTALALAMHRLETIAGQPLQGEEAFPLQDWLDACEAAIDAIGQAGPILYDEDRPDRDSFGLRRLRERLDQMDEALIDLRDRLGGTFQEADQSRFAIVEGEAGSGKSHLMAREVGVALDAGEPAIMLLGTDFRHGDEPGVEIARRLELPGMTTEKLLGALGAAAAARGTRALICIDALNEGGGAQYWRNRLAGFAAQVRANPRLALCVSCRDVYSERVFTASSREHAAEIVIAGFETEEERERAAVVYMDRRGITRPASPWLPPEFVNPLFLRTTCVALQRQGKTQFPLGLRGSREMLRFYLDAAATTLGTIYDGSAELVAPLTRGLLDIAGAMADGRVDYIERRAAACLLDAAFASYQTPNGMGWLDLLRLRGLLRYDPPPYDEEAEADPLDVQEDVLRFAFQRIQDQLVAKSLTQGMREPGAPFEEDAPFAFMLGRWGIEDEWRGVFDALGIVFADEWRTEIVDHLPGGVERWWGRTSIQAAFVESVRWRQHGSFSDRTVELLNRLSWQATPLDLLIELSAVEGHPWNGDMLHRNLVRRPLPERDAFWTQRVNGEIEQRGTAYRLASWGLGQGPDTANSETVRLALSTLGWILTSSNRTLRDRATKAATEILMRHPGAAAPFVERFAGIDDPYVVERVLAAVAGACLRNPQADRVATAADAIWRHVFSGASIPLHILARDYGRLVMELALDRDVLPEGCDIARCRPPYGSRAPRFGLDQAKVEAEAEAVGDRQIAESCFGFAGDFGEKIIKSRIREFTSISLSRPRPMRLSQAFDAFKARWITGDEMKEILLDLVELTAPRSGQNGGSDERETFAHADRHLRQLLGVRATKAYDEEVIPHLKGRKGWSGIGKELPLVDSQQARLWIARRAIRLGWLSKRFPRDYGAGSDTAPHARIERIGKKYQWIAFHELLARLADNVWLAPEWGPLEARAYDVPTNLPFLRDIEPTVRPIEDEDTGYAPTSIPAVPHITIDKVATEDMPSWVFDNEIPHERLSLGLCGDVSDGDWLTLYRYTDSKTRHPGVDRMGGAPFRLNDFHFLMMVGIEAGQEVRFARQMSRAWADFHHDWMMWGDLTDGPYVYEAGLRSTWPDTEWVDSDGIQSAEARYLRFCRQYRWEHHLDATLPSGLSMHVPSPWLLKELNIQADPNLPGVWVAADGQQIIVSSTGDRNSFCLVRRGALEAVLEARGVTPLWVGIGERGAWPDAKENAGPQRRWNGVFWQNGEDVLVEAWAEDHRPERPMRQEKVRLYQATSNVMAEAD